MLFLPHKDSSYAGYICNRFLQNHPNEICSLLSEKASRFLKPEKSKITVTKEKERRKRESEEKERRRREKSNGCTLGFYNSYFGKVALVFGPKKLLDAKGPSGDNVFKNPARFKLSLL